MCISNDGIENGDRLGAAGSLDQGDQTSFCPTGQMALVHVEPRPLASQQGISGVTAWPAATVVQYLFPPPPAIHHPPGVGTNLPLTCH